MEGDAYNAGPGSAARICSDREVNTSDRKPMRKYLLLGGIAAALLTSLIALVFFCSRRTGFTTTNDLMNATVEALKAGDGEQLMEMTELAEKFIEANPLVLGEGDTPENIMRTYYADLTGPFAARLKAIFGEDYNLLPWF